ncbi:sigma-70 family RNA polymerase sigma factor [Paenibacillus sp. N1-5-1-14]|uniref:sigma-70 family RNA polymerase sigma factor n=1 Tax=Paenibacillus radicibacter TaxID=2972488 RepID=UPI002158C0FF|nr:sigma-70 family RNA polymerase sigma factor [Paenibacillus radicibacter]MCR8643306.1 sigma-70 family RNA polymerase sigma factor [Paenibacillus radicibacter]
MNDQELSPWIDRLIEGEQEAFEVIYDLTKKKVYGTVAMLIPNKEDVHDIVNEVYCQMFKSLPTFDRSRPFLYWVNGIVMNQINGWRRQVWRRFRLLQKQSMNQEHCPSELPDELLIQSEVQQQLLHFIGKLPFKLRVVVLYRYYYEYSNDEIAELLRIPVGTVKSRNSLALKQIRQRFGNHLVQEVVFNNV